MLDSATRLSFAFAVACAIAYPVLSHSVFILFLGIGFDRDIARLIVACTLLALTLVMYGLLRQYIQGFTASEESLLFGHMELSSSRSLLAWTVGSILLGILLALASSSYVRESNDVLSASAMYMLVSGVIAPVSEEFAYRGIVLYGLTSAFGVSGSLVVSSALFALSHGDPGLFVPLLMAGLLLGFVRLRSGLMMPCVVLHGVANLAAFPLALFDMPAWLPMASATMLLVIVLVCFFRGIRN